MYNTLPIDKLEDMIIMVDKEIRITEQPALITSDAFSKGQLNNLKSLKKELKVELESRDEV